MKTAQVTINVAWMSFVLIYAQLNWSVTALAANAETRGECKLKVFLFESR